MAQGDEAGRAGRDYRSLLALSRRQAAHAIADCAAIGRAVFAGERGPLTDRERALVIGLMRGLAGDAGSAVLQAARALPDASRAVAVPPGEAIFERLAAAGSLQDERLIEAALHRMREFQLELAITARAPGQGWDADGDVAAEAGAALAGGAGRPVIDAIDDYLAERAVRTDVYGNPVLPLAELDDALVQDLFWSVAAAMRRAASAPESADDPADDAAMETAVRGALAGLAARGPSRLAAAVDALAGAGRLDAALAVEAMRLGEVQLCMASLARLSGIRRALVYRMMFQPGATGRAILCRAVDMRPPDFAELDRMIRAAGPVAEAASDDPGIAYEDLPRDEAGKVVAYWRLSEAYLRALRQYDRGSDDGQA